MLYNQRESILIRKVLKDFNEGQYKRSEYIDHIEDIGDLDLSEEKDLLKLAIEVGDIHGLGEAVIDIKRKVTDNQTQEEKLIDQFSLSADRLLENYDSELQFMFYYGQIKATISQLRPYLSTEVYKEVTELNLKFDKDKEETQIDIFEVYNKLWDNTEAK